MKNKLTRHPAPKLKRRVLLIIGGRSGEHEISLISGKNVLQALDRSLFDPLVLVIQKSGVMTLCDEKEISLLPSNPEDIIAPKGKAISIRPYKLFGYKPALVNKDGLLEFDVTFPLLHGPGGEDGTIQGIFEAAGIPVVGCGVKASAICMDKGTTKRICEQAGIPVVPYREIFRGEDIPPVAWPFPIFAKPAHLGSSIGVEKVSSYAELKFALKSIFSLDDKAIIEPAIDGREIEIAVIGTRSDMVISPPGEIQCEKNCFYTYEIKYVEKDAAKLILPAIMSGKKNEEIRRIAADIFKTLECQGMARIDFFMTPDGRFLLNEVNTIPGFTEISMYPKLLELSGIYYTELITRLIDISCDNSFHG